MRADAIAEAIGAPRNYLAKTLNALAKSGVVRSSRGPFGGFSLAIDPAVLTVARVTQIFDERPRTGHCLLSKARCDADNPCAAHVKWTAITASALSAIETTTVEELLGGATTPADMAPSHARPWLSARKRAAIVPDETLRAS